MPADLVSAESLLPGSCTAIFSMCSHVAEGAKGALWGLSRENTNPIHALAGWYHLSSKPQPADPAVGLCGVASPYPKSSE